MFGWFKTVGHYRRKYERQFEKSGFSNENLWRYFAENKTFSRPEQRWNSDQAGNLNVALGSCEGPSDNAQLDYYKNIYAAAKNYSDAKEQQTWAAWSSQGKERLGQAKAMQAMIRKQLMTPEKLGQMKRFLEGKFSVIMKKSTLLNKDDISELRTLIPLTELLFDIAGNTESGTILKILSNTCKSLENVIKDSTRHGSRDHKISDNDVKSLIGALIPLIQIAILPASSSN